jgi:hypothetical protein
VALKGKKSGTAPASTSTQTPGPGTSPTLTPVSPADVSARVDTSWINPQRWIPLSAPLQSRAGSRGPNVYYSIAQQFRVTEMPRYVAQPPQTWCNIYAWDVTKAMGAEIPHWYDKVSGVPMPVGKGSEMRANDMVTWLDQGNGGWRQVPGDTAKARAAVGYPTVVIWANPSGPGHVAMLLPDGSIAQAGATNLWRASITSGFGYRAVKFFTHD